MFGRFFLIAIGWALLVGCYHAPHAIHGEAPAEALPAGVRVAIGSSEVKEGDKINVLKKVCETRASKGGSKEVCTEKKVGEALVLKVIDHDASIVKPDTGVNMDSVYKVEKK